VAYRAQGGPSTSEHDRTGDAAHDKGDTATGMTGGSAKVGRFAVLVLLAVLPWTWFLLRDALGPVTDLLAIVLPTLAVLVALVALVAAWFGRGWRPVLVLAVSTVIAGIVATVLPWVPQDAGTTAQARSVRIAAANIGAGELEGSNDLIGLAADVLVISEIGEPLTARLSAAYPHHTEELTGPNVGIFSRLPFTVLERPNADLPGFMLRVNAPTGPFDLIATHVPRPWYTAGGPSFQTTIPGHHRLIEQIADRVRRDRLPVVVAGDLNTTDRGRDYRVLTDDAGLTDAMREDRAAPTQIGAWATLFVRIDHILISHGWCSDDSRRYEVPASDHRGIMARIGPCL
jgi:endonuclease/exonuclease/phosphatase (EEP) superfamily protein YafD